MCSCRSVEDTMEISDEVLRGFHPPSYIPKQSNKNNDSRDRERIHCISNGEKAIFENVKVTKPPRRKDKRKITALTPHTSICLVFFTVLFSVLPSWFHPPLYPASLMTFLLMILDRVKSWQIFFTVVTLES